MGYYESTEIDVELRNGHRRCIALRNGVRKVSKLLVDSISLTPGQNIFIAKSKTVISHDSHDAAMFAKSVKF